MLKQLTESYIDAFANKDLTAVSALLSEDFVLEDPVIKRIHGKSAALVAIGNIFSSCKKLDFKAKKVFLDGNSTIIEFILELDGMRLEGVDIIEWQDGRMTELRAYLDIPKEA